MISNWNIYIPEQKRRFKVVLDDRFSPPLNTAGEQAKLLPREDLLAGEHCLAFTLPLKRTVSSRVACFLVPYV